MKLPTEEFAEYVFRFVVIASGILTTILLIAAVIRLLDTDVAGLSQ
ncbi:hypothetical protein [Microvirga sp. VF16]|nr:hypothetical protein [Microvirga sp. VF16]QRM27832.1 hypothetical protein JO965_16370 [Microvirga sp. VF16]